MTLCDPSGPPALHPALADRFSPTRFDSDAVVSDDQLDSLLDAARRAPSAGNSQPWMFIVGPRGGATHARIARHVARSAAAWATDASLLVVNLAHLHVEGTIDWAYSEFSRYDLGQAVAHMTIQGLSIGLHSHQFRAFDRQAVAHEFDVPPHWEVTSMTAFGVAAHPRDVPVFPGTSRERASLDDIVWPPGGRDVARHAAP